MDGLLIDRFRRSRRRLRIAQWTGLAVVVMPFIGVVAYELLAEPIGSSRYLFVGFAVIGMLTTLICRLKEKRLIADFYLE